MKNIRRYLAVILALALCLGLLPAALAAGETLEDYDAPSAVRWSFPTLTGETVDQDTLAGENLVLIFYRANGACGNSNSTLRALAGADWTQADDVQVVAVGCGEVGEDADAVRDNAIALREEYAPDCENVWFCYATSDQMWKTLRGLQTLVGGETNHLTYAVNYIFDGENHLRFTWQGGYKTANYTAALASIRGDAEAEPTQTPEPTPEPTSEPTPGPTPTPAPEPTPGAKPSGELCQLQIPGANDYDSAYAVLDLLNAYRRENGLSALVMDRDLLKTGMLRAAEIAIFFDHTRPDQTACFTAFPDKFFLGTRRENIAVGQRSAEAVMDSWKNSSGHNANMLGEDNQSVGIGAFRDTDGTVYWVQVFSSRPGQGETSRSSGVQATTAEVDAAPGVLDLAVSPTSVALHPGETAALTLENVNPEWRYATPVIRAAYTASDREAVARAAVDTDGTVKVTAVAAGSTTVRVGLTSSLMVQVPVTVTPAQTEDKDASDNNAPGGSASTGGSTGGSNRFRDVARGSWYEPGVTYVVGKGLFNGTSATTFSPNTNMTRGMLMTVLARLAGQSTDGGAAWYSKGMAWAKAQGVSDGTNPEGSVNREQLVTMLYRYAKSPAVDAAMGMAGFVDTASISDWAADAVRWAVRNGILTGKDGGRLDPQGTATRAEVATILQRYVNL